MNRQELIDKVTAEIALEKKISDYQVTTYDVCLRLADMLVKNCSIPDVSQQRELLLAYERYKEKYPLIGLETDEWKIDKFLSQ